MKKFAALLFVNYILVILQTAYFVEFFGSQANPNLILALTLGFLYIQDYEAAYLNAFIGGILYDISTSGTLGLTTLTFVVFVFVTKQIRKFYLRSSLSLTAVFFFFFVLSAQIALRHLTLSFAVFFGSLVSCLITVLVGRLLVNIYEKHTL